jgi:hypothetical protein
MIMASINKRKVSTPVFTHEGGKASHIGYEEKLQRTVLSCLLNEDTFYEDGQSVKDRIKEYMGKVSTEFAIATLNKVKHEYHLRHTPLFMLTVLAQQGKLTKELVESTVTRVDDITELLAMSLADGKKALPKQLQKGLALAFAKFDEYQFGKYKGTKKAVSLKDAVMLCHPKAPNDEKNALYKKIVDNSLATPLTWETELSAGKDKKAVFENLLSENKLGGLALLRNLRNMEQASVSQRAIVNGIEKMNVRGIMPYNFYTANKYSAGTYSKQLEAAMLQSARETFDKLEGNTLFMVDTSGSMSCQLSGKGEITRAQAAASLAAIMNEVCEFAKVYTFDNTAHLCTQKGFALADRCARSMGGTDIQRSTNYAVESNNRPFDRVIIITDEQSSGSYFSKEVLKIPHKYIVNVATYQNGIEYGNFIHINGFSDGIFKYIAEYEKMGAKSEE